MSSLMRANSPFDLGGAVDMVLLDGCGTRDRLTMRWVVAGRNGPQPRVALTAEMGMSTQRSAAVAFTGEYHEMCSPPDAGHAPHARRSLTVDTPDNWTSTMRRLWPWPVAILVSWFESSYVISRNIGERFPIFGASGAIVFGLLTRLLLAVLFRAAPEVRET